MSEHEHPKESSGEDAMATGPGAPRGDGLGFHFSLEGNEQKSGEIWRNPQLAMQDKKIGVNEIGILLD